MMGIKKQVPQLKLVEVEDYFEQFEVGLVE